jgi:hypothetical protein
MRQTSRIRILIAAVVLVLVAVSATAGPTAAHNPACHQTAGSNGPHYDDDPRTGSGTAFEKNPTLGGEYPTDAVDGCSVGDSRSPRVDD